MSIATQIQRIIQDKTIISNKLVELGINNADESFNLDELAAEIDNIANQGAVSKSLKEGESYTIPAGYHNGSGVVTGVSGGGNYSLQVKSVTPTKNAQTINPDDGYYGIGQVQVAAIPAKYQDVSSVTAEAANVLTGKTFVTKDGTVTAGTMANNGSVSKTLDTATTSYTIPAGYHSGSGTVKASTTSATVTPTKAKQTVNGENGAFLSIVVVDPIPSVYQNVSEVDLVAEAALEGYVFVDAEGNEVTGTMANNGTVSETLSWDTKTFYNIPEGYHSGSGKVFITLEQKTVTPTKSSMIIVPSGGKVLSKVNVAAIPDEYQDVSGVDLVADAALEGYYFVDAEGNEVAGTMPRNGAISGAINVMEDETSYTIPAGHTTGGVVAITQDLEEALAAI